jgi:capsular polysaccharide biosynthesis protein
MKVDFGRIECRSAFDLPNKRVRVLEATETAPTQVQDIRLVELADVLYLPHVLDRGQSICLAEQRIVPQEVVDAWSVGFFQTTRFTNPEYQHRYADDFEADAYVEPVCILGNLFSRNFGHWTEELLKVALLEHSAQECRYVITTLPSFARDFLTLLGVGDERIVTIDHPTVFARAVFTTPINHENISRYPIALLRLRSLVASSLDDGPSAYGRRLWLERGQMLRSGGVTVNRDEVYDHIRRHGFDVLDPATLSVPDQLRAVRGAGLIAGSHGSQFVLAQFMPMASTVIECFSPMHVNPSILQICSVLKHSYHQVVARSHLIEPYRFGRDCKVDCEHLALLLDSL